MYVLENGDCLPPVLVGVNVFLASVDAVIAFIAFSQLIRIHLRTKQLGWTRQKVFHLMIGSSNVGYFVYLLSTLVATCKGWLCWSNACGFILMACPKILFLAAFLLILSFWVDLRHQTNYEEEDDDDNSSREPLLEKRMTKPHSSSIDDLRRCFPFQSIHVGSRQKFVILVVLLIFVIMVASAMLIWIGMGKNPIDSSVVARVYTDMFAIAVIILGGALATYGVLLFLKMKNVRSDKASTEMWKVAGLAVVSVVCFTTSAVVALASNVPLLYHWHPVNANGVITSVLIIIYYFIGSSVPSAFVLWVMREMPPPFVDSRHAQSRVPQLRTVPFIEDRPVATHQAHRWTTVTSSQNKASRASPI
ncbi:tobamovirus multiplication protein 1-like isoform X1 [Papaver somniferum]|uniref:tobamovirus multiplication protein 1-like isoform X1 n=2 Tax=Papaver somniferum TaxID=3469 RepID=UPI000E6FD9AA|nr:tobamovirus multiplication protein 1-like isoform X1 [Papaver somniferum]